MRAYVDIKNDANLTPDLSRLSDSLWEAFY